MTPNWYIQPRPAIPRYTIALSLAAIAVPMAAEIFLADLIGHCQALVWLTAIIPSFLLAYYRGWRGAATALAAAMAALSITQIVILLTVGHVENWPLVLIIVVVFCTVAVANGISTERLHEQRAAAELMALTDDLTGLPNRRFAERFLDREFAAATRGRDLAIAVFDIDNFKDYNDRHGHAAGDRALIIFAQLLDEKTRKMDFSARYGGEEFLAILSDCDLEGALHFVERVRDSLQQVDFIEGPITVSAGVATFQPTLTSPAELLAAADRALYRAKKDGRDCVRVADHGPEIEPPLGLEPV